MKRKDKSKIFTILILAGVFVSASVFFVMEKIQVSNWSSVTSNQLATNNDQRSQTSVQQSESNSEAQPQIQQQNLQTVDPVDGTFSRITKKPFGIFITPKTSPVQPERFQGYHTAVDLETTPEEQNIDVPVRAMCDGKLLVVRFVSGYGGLVAQSCMLDGQAATVIYGHIDLASMNVKVGSELKAGDFLANLGKGFTSQTDGERKHLHLGIHKGSSVNILGYVQSESQLSGWIDPVKYLQ